MSTHRLLIVTGASGAGKTTLNDALAARRLPGVASYSSDREARPPLDTAATDGAGPEVRQRAMLDAWIRRLASPPPGVQVSVLDTQARPSDVRRLFAAHGVEGAVVLVDCAYSVRNARLVADRQQPDLASPTMDQWAAYLKGQADALDLDVIDTTDLSVEAGTDRLEAIVTALQTP